MKLKHRALFIRNAGGTFTPIDVFSGDGQGGGGTSDHSQLINRTAADSHPMSAITGLVAALAAKFVKPETGIPKSDLASAVQASLGLADSAVQPEAGKGLFSGNYNDLTNKPTIPSAVTESTVTGWGFTKNTGTYSKPSGGIPKTDLASAVQTSLGLADSAVQPEAGKGLFSGSYNDLTDKPTIPSVESDPVFSASAAAGITSANIAEWNGKQAAKIVRTALLPATIEEGGTLLTAWIDKTQTINVSGVTASNTVQISAADKDSADIWADCGVWCTSQGVGTLTFTCETVPEDDISLSLLIWN